MPAISIRRALSRPRSAKAPDAAASPSDARVVEDLRALLGTEQVLDSQLDLVRYATDASPYRLMPRAIAKPRSAAEVGQLFAWATRTGHGLTLRAAGTSLNGQSQSDDVLVDVREGFGGTEVLEDGARLRARPGVVMTRANAVLARHGRKLGPDPASSAAATIGGVVANNASGMTCGVRFNSYHTLDEVTLVLASGTVVDTGARNADERLRAAEPALCDELLAIRADILADEELVARLRRKFAIKNTSGYHLDAFCDSDSPTGILRRLVVGSEGTLAFIADTVWHTVPLGRRHTTAFFRFPTLHQAAAAVPALNEAGSQAVELLDAASLRSAAAVPGAPGWMAGLGPQAEDAALLVELRSDDDAELDAFEHRVRDIVAAEVTDGAFTRDSAVSAGYWAVRSGLLALVGAARPAHTALITEDVCVPPATLAQACTDLEQLLVTHGFTGAVNGHASAGNLHFYLYLDATRPEQVATYRAFMEDLVTLICERYDGSLKGEHGTGRNMAPYIVREWGQDAVDLMWRVKRAMDPHAILGPGVFLNTDPEVTYRNLKSMPAVAPDLDPCIECGFCEPVCPSRHLTTTPRQRIALQREMARQGWDGPLESTLVEEYEYGAVNTCAGDSSCAIACPVGIDTGHAMKRVRRDSFSPGAQRVGEVAARRWGIVAPIARAAVGAAGVARHVIGNTGLRAVTDVGRAVLGKDVFPGWIDEMPRAARRVPRTRHEGADAVFFAACINRIFGPSRQAPDQTGVTEALVRLAARAGKRLWIPEDIGDDCCATIWQSKGLDAGNRVMAARVVEDMFRWSDGGRLPIVVDASSCTLGVTREVLEHVDDEHRRMHAALTIVDAMTWTLEHVVPSLPEHATEAMAVIHPTCSMNTLGISGDLERLAAQVADVVVTPVTATCCGTAGDRGFLHPELTESATREEVAEIADLPADAYLSGNRTCELGLEHDSGEAYESVIIALERLTRPSSPHAPARP